MSGLMSGHDMRFQSRLRAARWPKAPGFLGTFEGCCGGAVLLPPPSGGIRSGGREGFLGWGGVRGAALTSWLAAGFLECGSRLLSPAAPVR